MSRHFSWGKSIIFIMVIISLLACNQESDKKETSIYLTKVENYAKAMITHGRDTYGEENSPLFASALNRESLKLDQKDSIEDIDGVRKNDRSLAGANMIHDIDLLQTLYTTSEVTGDESYKQEADQAIDYFFNNCQSSATGLMCWGEHLYWDFLDGACGYGPNYDYHEAKKWPFWDQAYEYAPDVAWKFVLSEWDHQINDKSTGDFSRHARYSKHETFSGFEFPRYAGQLIERWADAYQRPENASRPRREEIPHFIEVVFGRMQENMELSPSGYLIAGQAEQGDHINVVWLTSNLELARCLEEAAPVVSPELGKEMRAFAIKQDLDFLKTPHKLDSVGGGFAVTLHATTGLPRVRSMNKPYSSTWSSGYGYGTHAEVANTIFDRYGRLKSNHVDIAMQYKDMILKVGEKYLTSAPDTTLLLKPNEFSDVIQLMLNCHELSADNQFLTRAEFFAKFGIELFLSDDSPLPKATNRHKHYESITGGPSFMYQLLKLHQAMNN